ncbi:MAG TPA: hypothetical protein VMW25_01715 [Clostridia bacterium]|nr:hypothetical protein [Clostridia bacterium]
MKLVFLLILLLFLLGLGSVAVQNFWGEKTLGDLKLFPDQFRPAPPTESPSSTPEAVVSLGADWRTFNSEDQSFRFQYPGDWKLIKAISSQKNSKGVYGIVVQGWELLNFEPSEDLAELPAEAVKIEFEILTEGRKQTVDGLVDCEGPNMVECQTLNINGVDYKKLVTKNSKGGENIILATVKNDRIYRISGLINSSENQEGRSQLEQVISTFEILEIS